MREGLNESEKAILVQVLRLSMRPAIANYCQIATETTLEKMYSLYRLRYMGTFHPNNNTYEYPTSNQRNPLQGETILLFFTCKKSILKSKFAFDLDDESLRGIRVKLGTVPLS